MSERNTILFCDLQEKSFRKSAKILVVYNNRFHKHWVDSQTQDLERYFSDNKSWKSYTRFLVSLLHMKKINGKCLGKICR